MKIIIGQGMAQSQLQLLELSKDQKIPGFSVLMKVTPAFFGNPSTTALQPIKQSLKAARIYFNEIREDAPLQPSGSISKYKIKIEVTYKDLQKRDEMMARLKNDTNFQLSIQLGDGVATAPRTLLISVSNRKIKWDSFKNKATTDGKENDAIMDTSENVPPVSNDVSQSQAVDTPMNLSENALQEGSQSL